MTPSSPTELEQRRAKLAEQGTHLTALHNSPSYQTLKNIVEQRVERDMRRFISEPVVDQRALDYARGMMEGMGWVLRVIEGGEQQLVKAAKAAEALQKAI